jgi:hypothetical protein
VLAGTLLARPTEIDETDTEVDVTPDGGNTGNGTVTAIVVGAGTALGEYTLEVTAEKGDGGTFSFSDPDSELLADDWVLTGTSGASDVFTAGGVQVTITDGSTDFKTGDTFALTVAATGVANVERLVPFDPDGSDGYEIPSRVLTYEVVSGVGRVVSVSEGESNKGDGTVTATITGDTAVLGAYSLVCTAEVENGGVFTLTDPNGEEVDDAVTMTPGAGGETVYTGGGLRLVITDGAEDFDETDEFTILVAEEVVTKPVRAMISGQVNRDRLIIHKDGDGDDITAAHLDTLRSFDIVATPVQLLGAIDNQ